MGVQWPDKLKNLPVAKSIDEGQIPIGHSYAMIAHTGSGKTMLIPAVEALKGESKVILRQPTRQTARSVYLGLKHFWGEQLKIGISTSEHKELTLEEADIMVCTDGNLRNWLREPKYRFTVIFDEFHWQMSITELELGIVKKYLNEGKSFTVVLLSATIRPENILRYFEGLNDNQVSLSTIRRICDTLDKGGEAVNSIDQPQWLKVCYSEGVAHNIENNIEPLREDFHHEGSVMDFCTRMLSDKKRGLIFMATRGAVTSKCLMVEEYLPNLPVRFAHADVDIEEIIDFVNDNEPSVVMATVSLATSITLPFDEVLIIDSGIDSVYEDGVQKTLTHVPLDSNGILQRRGRVGRTKAGIATLASNHRKSWDEVTPHAIEPPLQKVPPDVVVLTAAKYGIDIREIDILSNIHQYDIEQSIGKLYRWGLIKHDDDNNVSLTKIGNQVYNMPLEIDDAYMVVISSADIKPVTLAIAVIGRGGMFSMFRNNIPVADGRRVNGIEFLDKKLISNTSTPMTKARILQEATRILYEDDDEHMKKWAAVNGLLPKRIEKIIDKYVQVAETGLRKVPENIIRQFISTDLDEMESKIISLFKDQNVYDTNVFEWSVYKGRGGWKGEFKGYFAVIDSMEIQLMGLDDEGKFDNWITVMGTPKAIRTKNDKDMIIWSDTTLSNVDDQL